MSATLAGPALAGPVTGSMVLHITERRATGLADNCLCGHLWDRADVRPHGPMCGPCVEEFERRHGVPFVDPRSADFFRGPA